MNNPNTYPPSPLHASVAPLRAIGSAGAALAMVILGASVLLRLTTQLDATGAATSTLGSDMETVVRLTHRITASSVGLLAIAASWLCWRNRATLAQGFKPTAGIVAATLLLALIGPLTPGYRFAAVTVANVVGGTVLLMSFWWLRESASLPFPQRSAPYSWWPITFIALLTHIASGAAASALEMHGSHWVAYVHVGSAILFLFFLVEVLWDRSVQDPFNKPVKTMTALLVAQIAMGLFLMWLGRRPVWLGVMHALISQMLVANLVFVALHQRRLPE